MRGHIRVLSGLPLPPQANQPVVKLMRTRQNPLAFGRGRKIHLNCSRSPKAACDGPQADPSLSLRSHSGAGFAPHGFVGQAIEPKALGGVPQANL
ncbi:unnamed protein product [Dicrocoelium dendriticum]|nr:unnamed protein product [Dicrocoelium dendriticum]